MSAAWWIFVDLLATAHKMARACGGSPHAAAQLLDALLCAYRYDPATAAYFGGTAGFRGLSADTKAERPGHGVV